MLHTHTEECPRVGLIRFVGKGRARSTYAAARQHPPKDRIYRYPGAAWQNPPRSRKSSLLRNNGFLTDMICRHVLYGLHNLNSSCIIVFDALQYIYIITDTESRGTWHWPVHNRTASKQNGKWKKNILEVRSDVCTYFVYTCAHTVCMYIFVVHVKSIVHVISYYQSKNV